jgi:long-chain acyl-CoA synthetase
VLLLVKKNKIKGFMNDIQRIIRTAGTEKEVFNKLRAVVTTGNSVLYVGRLLQRAAQWIPESVALIFRGQEVSYRTLYYRAMLLSRVLRAHGIKSRDRVFLCFENSVEFYIGYFAILHIGAVVVPLNIFLNTHELTYIVLDAQPSCIIASLKLAKKFDEGVCEGILFLSEKDMAFEGVVPDQLPYFEINDLHSDEMAVLLYTSGTTGVAKGVMLSSKNLIINVIQGVSRFSLCEQERIFAVLPLFHSFAQNTCVVGAFLIGCTVIVVPKIERRAILEGLKYKPTIFLGVPALYGLLCLLKHAPLESVRIFASGGDALPDKIRSIFGLLYRRKICSGYGLTEASPLVAVDLDDVLSPTNTIGKPFIGIDVQLRDEQGNVVAPGMIGELWLKGDNVMLGYYNDVEKTAEVMRDGWLSTGDLAYVDLSGKLIITGRIKDLIIHKGFNIYPQEIENVILAHAKVLRVGVIGKEEENVGQVPVAYVQLKEEVADIEKILHDFCAKYLALYKIPRVFICVTKDLPITSTGKIDKKLLRNSTQWGLLCE